MGVLFKECSNNCFIGEEGWRFFRIFISNFFVMFFGRFLFFLKWEVFLCMFFE